MRLGLCIKTETPQDKTNKLHEHKVFTFMWSFKRHDYEPKVARFQLNSQLQSIETCSNILDIGQWRCIFLFIHSVCVWNKLTVVCTHFCFTYRAQRDRTLSKHQLISTGVTKNESFNELQNVYCSFLTTYFMFLISWMIIFHQMLLKDPTVTSNSIEFQLFSRFRCLMNFSAPWFGNDIVVCKT